MSRQFKLTILGSNSATPAYGRYPTCQYLNINDHSFLIDCGEGAQFRIAEYKLKRNKISYIFISHMHGDHIFGLPGLITSMNLNGRPTKLVIIGPLGIKEYLDTVLKLSQSHMNFELEIVEIQVKEKTLVLDLPDVTVHAFQVYHRIPTHGFLFEQKMEERNIRKEVIKKYDLNIDQIKFIKSGQDLTIDGKIIRNDELTLHGTNPCSYAYCADSIADDRIIKDIKNVIALYFETTYLNHLEEQAIERGHSTAGQAGEMANKSAAKVLITGHYSSRYKDVSPILKEAKSVFNNTILGYDGVMLDIQEYSKS